MTLIFIVVCYIAKIICKDDLKKYMNKRNSKKAFHVDLVCVLMATGRSLDWDGINDQTKNPTWIRRLILYHAVVRSAFCKMEMSH